MYSNQSVAAHWRASAAYLYVLHLDSAQLAWEYLRRNPAYRQDWRSVHDTAQRWGLELAEDPLRDARLATPLWCGLGSGITLVAASDQASPAFPFWELPGVKRLGAVGQGLHLALRQPRRTIDLNLHPSFSIDQPFAYLITSGAGCNSRCRAVQELSASYSNSTPRMRAGRPSATAVNHMRMLQALDADIAGATHRSIAQLLLGDTLQERWTPDGEVRARIRHWVRRARALSAGDYRQLLTTDSV